VARIIFKAFLSCSFAPEDKEIVDFFTNIIKSFEIEPELYDYQTIGRVSDEVKAHIIRSDCLIAIATRRKKIEGSDYWTYPDWIQHEITLANAYNKPIAIFFEEGVQIEGFIGMEERREKFVREDLVRNVDKITRFLFNLRDYISKRKNSDAGPSKTLHPCKRADDLKRTYGYKVRSSNGIFSCGVRGGSSLNSVR
jgi:hypothetical protein